jgi:hypothetical protein
MRDWHCCMTCRHLQLSFTAKLSQKLGTYSPEGQGMGDRRLPEKALGDLRMLVRIFVRTPPDRHEQKHSFACEMR